MSSLAFKMAREMEEGEDWYRVRIPWREDESRRDEVSLER
jgi:hypothetical protein